MNRITRVFVAIMCAACTVFALSACGQPAKDDVQVASKKTEQKVEEPAQKAEEAPEQDDSTKTDDGRIDVSSTGVEAATYGGAKYIVSDATIDQGSSDAELGLQEVCVIKQPNAWESIGSIGWTRNSISYTNIEMPWGSAAFAYTYMNEAGAAEEAQAWSRTTEQSYFEGAEGVGHVDVDGHHVAYLRADSGQADMGIPDMEAQADGWNPGAMVTLYTYEQRGDKCALSCNAVLTIAQGSESDFSDEELVKMAYEPLEFAQKGEEVDAASFMANLTITSGEGDDALVVSRQDDELLSYEEHKVSLLEDADPGAVMRTTVYDFAPTVAPAEDAERLEVGGREVLATMRELADVGDTGFAERTVDAWIDINGSMLHVEATMGDDEDLASVLERVVANRIAEA